MKNPYPFELCVDVYRRPWMRCDSLEFELYMGRKILENLFDTMEVDTETTSVFLSFPERWCNIVEERSIFDRLVKYYPNVKSVNIKTQSVYIIQSTPAGCCRIVSSEAEQAYVALAGHLPQERDNGRLCFPVVNVVVDANKLNVLGV